MKTEPILANYPIDDKAYLTSLSDHVKMTFEIRGRSCIGRLSDSDICLPDPTISSRHAMIERRHDGFFIKDLKSSNGTFVNGSQVVEAKLNPQDRLRVGATELIFTTHKNAEVPSLMTTSLNQNWNQQLRRLPAMAQSPHAILITGPSGTGKEVLANLIHKFSVRAHGPMISVNCSTLTENLAESELFGHVKGSFTGSQEDRLGAFESARGGTLFLDEIGDMPLSLQPKLLRALENNEIRPVGSDRTVKIDCRIVAATNKNLRTLVSLRKFREDLYYRLHVLQITTPALVERLEDLEALVKHYCQIHNVKLSPEALQRMQKYDWPGNIRELKNMLARISAIFPGRVVFADDIEMLFEPKHSIDSTLNQSATPLLARDYMREYEREAIIQKLAMHYGNQRAAARDLGMAKSTLHDRIRRYNIDPREYKRRWRG